MAPFYFGEEMDESTTGADAESTSDPAPEAESTSEKAEEQTSAESTSEDEAEDDEPEEWRNLVKKYESVADEKARKAAIGKAYWENTRHASAAQKERDQLKARIAELEAGSTPVKEEREARPEPETPPDIKALESRKEALEAEKAEFPKIEDQLLTALGKTDQKLAVLQYKLSTALEEEKSSIEARIETASAERSGILLRYHTCKQRLSEIAEKLEDLGERRKLATSRLEADRARQAQAEEERAQFNRDFPRQVDAYIQRFMDELKVPVDEKLREDLAESVNESLMVAYWKMGGQDTRAVDHAALVKDHVTRYAKRMDLIGRAKFKQFSTNKADIVKRLSPTITPRETKPKEPERPKLPYEVEVRDDRLEQARKRFMGR